MPITSSSNTHLFSWIQSTIETISADYASRVATYLQFPVAEKYNIIGCPPQIYPVRKAKSC